MASTAHDQPRGRVPGAKSTFQPLKITLVPFYVEQSNVAGSVAYRAGAWELTAVLDRLSGLCIGKSAGQLHCSPLLAEVVAADH